MADNEHDARAPRAAGPKGPDEPPGERKTGRPGEQTVLERDPKVQKPRMWRVLLHNDDYTTMEFVVWVLQRVFSMGIDDAHALMWAIHKQGRGVAGVFTRDIAETKAMAVRELADENGMPLMCTTEPDD
ncbi:MAG: ATP-dependent Clp protease adaptor ClpS [Deltaproteobacteria bacterium]|nr:ATP-dependent Clp protease adaptor ClpS [Deltaproteobacteria bacterium]